MSVLFSCELGWIISHEQYFTRIPVRISGRQALSSDSTWQRIADSNPNANEQQVTVHFKLNPMLFNIWKPYKSKPSQDMAHTSESIETQVNISEGSGNRRLEKRRRRLEKGRCYLQDKLDPGTESLRDDSLLLVQKAKDEKGSNIFGASDHDEVPKDNAEALEIANSFFNNVGNTDEQQEFHGQNCTCHGTITELNNQRFLIPANTWFHCRDIETIFKHLSSMCSDGLFDVVVMDPPWRNRYIRRRKRMQAEAGYHCLENAKIQDIPIEQMTKQGGLVVVWCTNSKSHQDKLLHDFFPKWGVYPVAKWFWLKVTRFGEPVVPFAANDSCLKQPFEVVFVGRRNSSQNDGTNMQPDFVERKNKWIVSVPSSVNSHKPPLVEVLEDHFSIDTRSMKCCEFFARSLLPGWTSYGNEVLKLQTERLYCIEGNCS